MGRTARVSIKEEEGKWRNFDFILFSGKSAETSKLVLKQISAPGLCDWNVLCLILQLWDWSVGILCKLECLQENLNRCICILLLSQRHYWFPVVVTWNFACKATLENVRAPFMMSWRWHISYTCERLTFSAAQLCNTRWQRCSHCMIVPPSQFFCWTLQGKAQRGLRTVRFRKLV